MANKEKMDYLLLDIRELETLIAGMRDAEVYPVSFFSQTFNLTHKILKDLHSLEAAQIEMLRKQMEEHQALLKSIPHQVAEPMPEIPRIEIIEEPKTPIPEVLLVPETKEIQPEQSAYIVPEPVAETQQKAATTERPGLFLSDLLDKKNLSDFRKAFSLNDRFRFRRELFGGNEERMNKAIAELNNIHTYEDSVTYLNNELKWNIEDEAVADFIKLLEKRFL